MDSDAAERSKRLDAQALGPQRGDRVGAGTSLVETAQVDATSTATSKGRHVYTR